MYCAVLQTTNVTRPVFVKVCEDALDSGSSALFLFANGFRFAFLLLLQFLFSHYFLKYEAEERVLSLAFFGISSQTFSTFLLEL